MIRSLFRSVDLGRSSILGALIMGLSSQAIGCPIPIVNPSFEQDVITGSNAPVFQIRSSAPSGWQYVSGTSHLSGIIAPDVQENMFYAGPTPGFDGEKVHFTVSGPGKIRQILSSTLQANTTYTLSVATGTRASSPVFGGYSIELSTVSGALVGQWRAGRRNLAPVGAFARTTRSFSTGPNPIGLGQQLQISVGQPEGVDLGGYTDLDMVSLTSTPAPAHQASTPVDVFLVMGQSNAHGWKANAAQLRASNIHYLKTPAPNALLAYTQRNITDLINCVGSMGHLGSQGSGFDGNYEGFGPELSLGTDLARQSNQPTALVKYAIGSASLQGNFRKDNPTDPIAAYHLYPDLVSSVTTSLQQLRDQGYNPNLKALFWLQGEGDTNTLQMASGYGTNIQNFVQALRNDLGAPNLKVFLTEINGNMPALAAKASETSLVNSGMQALAGSGSNCYFVPTADMTGGFADAVHYTADQTIEIGRRWARAYAEALSP